MSLSAAALRKMMEMGLSAEQMVELAEALEEGFSAPVPPIAERSAAAVRQARYRQRGGGKIPPELRQAVYERDGFVCVYCGTPDNLCCDHDEPVSRGGETTLENLVTACVPCNSRKKDRDRKAYQRQLSAENPRKSADKPADVSSEARPLDKEKSPTPPKEINPPTFADASSGRADATEWKLRLEEARLVGGEGLNLTIPAMHSFADLRVLVEPASGEPCTWLEVVDAIRIEAAKAKTRGRPIRSWTWVHETALAMRDRRLAGLPAPTAPVELSRVRPSAPSGAERRKADFVERLSDIGAAMDAAVRQAAGGSGR